MAQEPSNVDPVSVEVIGNYLTAISNEMSVALQRSSYNMMIYEVRDYCTAILNSKAELLSQNVGGVSHFIADLGVVFRDAVEKYGLDGFKPGDVIVTNHQKVAGQHLNNMVVYTPFFWQDRLQAFSCVRAHWVDVGGMSTGFGATGMVSDPWMEGLQLDQVKIHEAGRPNEAILKVIRDNIRFPDASLGDLRAQIAACRLAEARLKELYQKYGSETVDASISEIFKQTERRCRRVVRTFKEGTYEAESFVDDDTFEIGVPVRIKIKVEVKDGNMTVDFTGTSPQRRGPINSRTLAGATIAYKALTDPLGSVNEGSFRGLRVIMPEGSVMMAKYPAPMSGWSLLIPTVVDTMLLSLDRAVPGRIPAAHLGELGMPIVFFGTDKRGKRFVVQSIEGGGWGGRPHGDGPSGCISVCQGDVRNGPIENLELKCPIVVESRSLRMDSGGPGEFRGGLGVETRVRNLVEGRWNIRQPRRRAHPPWGLHGGGDGGPGRIQVKAPGSQEWKVVEAAHYLVPEQTLVLLQSAGGGGWGDPLERSPEMVESDYADGFVSIEKAAAEYGVVIRPEGGVDADATKNLRATMRRGRSVPLSTD